MNLIDILMVKYPPSADWLDPEKPLAIISNDGLGNESIVEWYLSTPEPTVQELLDWAGTHPAEMLKLHKDQAIDIIDRLYSGLMTEPEYRQATRVIKMARNQDEINAIISKVEVTYD